MVRSLAVRVHGLSELGTKKEGDLFLAVSSSNIMPGDHQNVC